MAFRDEEQDEYEAVFAHDCLYLPNSVNANDQSQVGSICRRTDTSAARPNKDVKRLVLMEYKICRRREMQ